MFNLFKYRKGQIRGIDFSLAMIIFLLTMSQLLVLTNTFIESSQSFQETSQKQNQTSNLAEDMLTTTGRSGTNTNWAINTTTELSNDWVFGLANNYGDIDEYKINRLSSNNLPDYLIDYSLLNSSISYAQDFKLSFDSSIEVSISQVSVSTATTLNVVGEVSNDGIGLINSETWIFAYKPDGSIYETYTKTNSTGFFDTDIDVVDITSDFIMITALSKSGPSSQSIDYNIFQDSPTNNYEFTNISLFEPTNSLGSSVDVSLLNNNGGSATISAFYGSPGLINYTSVAGIDNGNTWDVNLAIPEQGIVGILSHELVGGTHYIGFSIFPMMMNDDINPSISPLDPQNTDSTVVEKIILIRGIFMEMKLRLWSF